MGKGSKGGGKGQSRTKKKTKEEDSDSDYENDDVDAYEKVISELDKFHSLGYRMVIFGDSRGRRGEGNEVADKPGFIIL